MWVGCSLPVPSPRSSSCPSECCQTPTGSRRSARRAVRERGTADGRGARPPVVGGSERRAAGTDRLYRWPGGAMNVANGWAFWIGLIGALAVLYVLPTLIGVLRHVESLALVVILKLFPIAWPAALMAACMMPR